MAEFTIGLLLAEVREIGIACHALKSGKEFKANRRLYPDSNITLGPGLTGNTLGIVGLGRIGKRVALKARALGMEIICYDPYISKEVADEVCAKLVDFNTLLTKADFVTLHARLTPETRHMIGEEQLALMKRDAYLINTARGEMVDEKALYKALKERKELLGQHWMW